MADLLAIIKRDEYERESINDQVIGAVLQWSSYWSDQPRLKKLGLGDRLFLVTIKQPDEGIWLVAVLSDLTWHAGDSETRAHVSAKARNAATTIDITNLRLSLKFDNEIGLKAPRGKLANSLQTPRVLTKEDSALLDLAVESHKSLSIPQLAVLQIAPLLGKRLGHPFGWHPEPARFVTNSDDCMSYGDAVVLSLQDEIEFAVWLDYGSKPGPNDTPLLAAAFATSQSTAMELKELSQQAGVPDVAYGNTSKRRLRGYDGAAVLEADGHENVFLSVYRPAGDYSVAEAVRAFAEFFQQQRKLVELAVSQPPDVADEVEALEGELRMRMIRHRSRERWKRQQKIDDFKLTNNGRLFCEVPRCGFDFESVYGVEYAHVHHKAPLASKKGPSGTKLSDLAVVCPNCHAIIHHGGGTVPWSEIGSLLAAKS